MEEERIVGWAQMGRWRDWEERKQGKLCLQCKTNKQLNKRTYMYLHMYAYIYVHTNTHTHNLS